MTRAALLLLALSTAAMAQTSPAADPPRVRLQNDTPNIVNNVFISPASSTNWGRDQLGATETVAAGRSRVFTLPAGECRFDIRVAYLGGMAEEGRQIDLCAAPTITLPMAATRATR